MQIKHDHYFNIIIIVIIINNSCFVILWFSSEAHEKFRATDEALTVSKMGQTQDERAFSKPASQGCLPLNEVWVILDTQVL